MARHNFKSCSVCKSTDREIVHWYDGSICAPCVGLCITIFADRGVTVVPWGMRHQQNNQTAKAASVHQNRAQRHESESIKNRPPE